MDKRQQLRYDWIEYRAQNIVPTTPPTVEEIFSNAPEGDFKWEEEIGGDWHTYYCDDCQTWHKSCYTTTMGSKDGKRFIKIDTCDEDGNWDVCCGWEEGEDFSDIAHHFSTDDYFECWLEYWLYVAQTGEDPLRDVIGLNEDLVETGLVAAEINLRYLRMNKED